MDARDEGKKKDSIVCTVINQKRKTRRSILTVVLFRFADRKQENWILVSFTIDTLRKHQIRTNVTEIQWTLAGRKSLTVENV